MNKLWEKESDRENAVYVNILNPKYYDDPDVKRFLKGENFEKIMDSLSKCCLNANQPQKDATVAMLARSAGNSYFTQKKFSFAMDYYNQSLCSSEIGSENISLSYANRSACFFQMKMFDKCLVDIDLAIEAGYPRDKMEKLEKRRTDAKQAIKDGRLVQAPKPKLSYKPNEKVPVLADAVQIVDDPEVGHRFIATKNISVGQTIYLEPCYIGESYKGKYTACNICLKYNECLVPCKLCMMAMICTNESCQASKLHEFECGIKHCPIITEIEETNYLIPTVRSILLAVQMFPNIDALMAFVMETIANKSSDIPDFNDPISKYRTFLSHKTKGFHCDDTLSIKIYFEKMIRKPDIATFFNGKKYQRFLMHLIAQHKMILEGGNCIMRSVWTNMNVPSEQKSTPFELQMTILKKSFKYSCASHMAYVLDNGAIKGIVIRPLNKGEELTANQFNWVQKTDNERRDFLLKYLGARCQCPQCELSPVLLIQNSSLCRDPDYIKIFLGTKNHENLHRLQYSDEETEAMKKLCVSFLTKYGRLQWCHQLNNVVQIYRVLLSFCDLTPDCPLYQQFR